MPNPKLEYVVINDFTGGIQNKVLNTGVFSVPTQRLGTAVEEDTYGCVCLPTGGLGPLPERTYNIVAGPEEGDYPIYPNLDVPAVFISGAHLTGPILTSDANGITQAALYVATEYYEEVGAEVHRRWNVQQVGLWMDPPTYVFIDIFEGDTDTGGAVRGTWFTDYRSQTSEENESVAGFPTIVYSWYPEGGGTGDDVWHQWPNPTTPDTNTVYDINAAEWPGQPLLWLSNDKTVGHQGRFVGFEQTFYLHGSPTATWSSDEQIYFSRVNLQALHSKEAAAFGYEKMTGFGVAVSTSTDELFCVKHRGGAITVNGDLENPAIVWLPGVTSTGGYSTQAVYTPIGAVYGVKGGGVYAWAGGDNSVKISVGLEDDFWLAPGSEQFNGYRGQFAYWDDWIITPNNWLYDYQTESWWRLEDPDLFTWMYAQRDIVNNYLWCLPAAVDAEGDVVITAFDKTTPRTSFSFKSQPFAFTENRGWDVRELVLVAQGSGTVEVQLIDGNEVVSEFTFTISELLQPAYLRATGIQKLHQGLQIKFVSTGATAETPAPIIYELRIGHRPHAHLENEGQFSRDEP